MPPVPLLTRATRHALLLLSVCAAPALADPAHDHGDAAGSDAAADSAEAAAGEPHAPPRASTGTGDDSHAPVSAEIVVTAPYARDRASALSSVSVLQGVALTRELRSNIGDTLARQPGVSTTSFGPNASRPILRGFQGERIRLLTDGIGSFDVSNTSVDHAVVINPQLAERIEVLRGPASLLYGSSAIGGVVNVIDKRIPRHVPDEPVHLDLLGSYGSAAREGNFAGVVEARLVDRFVLHLDGSYSENGDLRIGDFVLSRPARAAALASGVPEAEALATLRGRLPNTAARTWSVGGGGAWIGDGGELGLVVSHYDSLYGVPTRFDLATGEGEAVQLQVEQTRLDARAQVEVGGFIDHLKLRVGYADYRHAEIHEGEVGTVFLNQGFEARLEAAQTKGRWLGGDWQGAVGGQLFTRQFDAVGDEAFIPRNQSVQYGLFTLQEVDWGAVRAEIAGRVEHSNVSSRRADFRGAPVDVDRGFTLFSGSIGGSWRFAPDWRIGVNLSHTERGPAAEELLANGPHAGTQAFEIGSPDFAKERADGAELVLRGKGRGYSFEASVYYNRFYNYIFEAQTGGVEDGLPVFQYGQAGARYFGFEVQGQVTVARVGAVDLGVDALADYVDARLLDGLGRVPRIPPFRVLGGVTASADRWDARAEVEHGARQRLVAPFETPTDGYTVVNLSASWRPFPARPGTALVVSANNVLDADVRRHASFLKDFAPLAGRDIRVSLRFTL